MILPVIFLFLCATSTESISYKGDPCSLKNGSAGVCKSLSNCNAVYQALVRGIQADLSECSRRNGWDEWVVCCPSNKPVTTTTPRPTLVDDPSDGRGAIARQKCAQYSQFVYALEVAPLGNLVNVSQCGIKSRALITGGIKADRKEFPHMAAVGFNLANGTIGWHCGGSLISEKFVLTAAHCIYSQTGGIAEWVRVGDLNLIQTGDGASPIDRRIARRIRHPQYNPPAQYHDIALLRLESRVPFNAWIRPACLHTSASTANTEKTMATGWGRVDWLDDEGSSDLLKVTLPLVDHSTCNSKYQSSARENKLPNGIVKDWMICAGQLGKDTCQGDSGGPLAIYSKPEHHCMYDIVGVTSLGKLCGSAVPGIYTRVYHYVSWIESKVWGRG